MKRDYWDELTVRLPALYTVKEAFFQVVETLKERFSEGKTLYVAGNGGSAADSDHIVGELMKGFMRPRREKDRVRERLEELFGEEGKKIAAKLQTPLKAVSLTVHPALITAFSNDEDPSLIFAQQLYGWGGPRDVFMGITTSGNSANLVKAFQVAKAIGMTTVLLTGRTGGVCAKMVDIAIKVPADETFLIQEYHLPIYHALCAIVEDHFFGEGKANGGR